MGTSKLSQKLFTKLSPKWSILVVIISTSTNFFAKNYTNTLNFQDRQHTIMMRIYRLFESARSSAKTKTKSTGQIKPKATWRAVDSPKKRTSKFGFFPFLLFTAKKKSFVRFLGESTARKSAYGFIWPLLSTKIWAVNKWQISLYVK